MIDKDNLNQCISQQLKSTGGIRGEYDRGYRDALIDIRTSVNSNELSASGIKISKAEMFELRDEIQKAFKYLPLSSTPPNYEPEGYPKLKEILDLLNGELEQN